MSGEMSTRAEVCAVACAELFRDAGEIMISPMALPSARDWPG
jgi:hypothetical protein